MDEWEEEKVKAGSKEVWGTDNINNYITIVIFRLPLAYWI